ncbi:hypothetical protein BT69DRAFT_1287299 [Atractiella rhizophila]|nr:hypothetical protein BT69DRAFT_1287299 [Atractiella rhizophila]
MALTLIFTSASKLKSCDCLSSNGTSICGRANVYAALERQQCPNLRRLSFQA